MLFSDISEFKFAILFVKAKQEKIEKMLNINRLDIFVAASVVYKFILKHKIEIQSKFTDKYTPLITDDFLDMVSESLKNAKKRGVKLKNEMPITEEKVCIVA